MYRQQARSYHIDYCFALPDKGKHAVQLSSLNLKKNFDFKSLIVIFRLQWEQPNHMNLVIRKISLQKL
jgi:hypothetical protein